MTLFLTSSIGPIVNRNISSIFRCNRFLEQLKQRWKMDSRVLIMAANPVKKNNDSWINVIRNCCVDGALSCSEIDLCDSRNLNLVDRIGEYDVVVLAGGHVPTQNEFFRQIDLREKMAGYQGIVIGISAGSMNCASTVYAHVEREGEVLDPNYRRFLSGLGLTERMILPHYHEIKNDVLDGFHVFEQVAYPDSMGKEFLCLPDGSYLMVENGAETIWGEAYSIRDGVLNQICRDGESLSLG